MQKETTSTTQHPLSLTLSHEGRGEVLAAAYRLPGLRPASGALSPVWERDRERGRCGEDPSNFVPNSIDWEELRGLAYLLTQLPGSGVGSLSFWITKALRGSQSRAEGGLQD